MLRAQQPPGDTGSAAARTLVPAGYGSLRREDVAIEVRDDGLTIRAIPLEEGIIRTLAPDSYQSLHALRERVAPQLARVAARTGLQTVQAWHVQFFNVRQGDARYDPRGMQVRSAGRDFRPLDVLPLVPGYDDGRLAQGRAVDAVFVFDPAIALDQPLTVTLGAQQSTAWSDVLLQRLDRERTAIWSRAAANRKPTSTEERYPWQPGRFASSIPHP
ncbi:MAG: hypothetical protein IT356_08070 [Gemmatimonadaceae bacterium]|nr:hypothetical protein [Gemmatimonadaceae bacterium]